jgi:hypothetical protein
MLTSPKSGTLYKAGQAVRFKGTATDASGKKLPASAFSWHVDYHAADGTLSPVTLTLPGKPAGSFKVAREGVTTAATGFHRIHLTVTDPLTGLVTTTFQDVHPRTAQVNVSAGLPGLKLNVNGSPVVAPLTMTALVGTKYNFAADATQIVDGVTYTFQKWNAGRRPELSYVVGAKDRTIEATYVPSSAT